MVNHGNLLNNERWIQCCFEHDAESTYVGWLPLYHAMGLIGCVLQALYLGSLCVLMRPTDFLQQPARWLQAIARFRAHTGGAPDFAYDLCTRLATADQMRGLDLSSWSIA